MKNKVLFPLIFSGCYIIFQAFWLKIILKSIQEHFYISRKRTSSYLPMGIENLANDKEQVSPLSLTHVIVGGCGEGCKKGMRLNFFNPKKSWDVERIPRYLFP